MARREFRPITQILRAENFAELFRRASPVTGVRGKANMSASALILSRPRWRFAYFAAMGKVGRRPQAAKSPCGHPSKSSVVQFAS